MTILFDTHMLVSYHTSSLNVSARYSLNVSARYFVIFGPLSINIGRKHLGNFFFFSVSGKRMLSVFQEENKALHKASSPTETVKQPYCIVSPTHDTHEMGHLK